jgi:hypothetical protein
MFAWCTERLHLSEAEAYMRIGAARASRRHPMLLAMLADGRLHLSGIERLAPHLTRENRDALLNRAVHKTKRQIEELVAELAPRPAAQTKMRKLPARRVPCGGAATRSELRPDGPGVPDGVPGAAGELRLDGVEASPPGLDGEPGPSAAMLGRSPAVDGVPPSDRELRPDGVDRAPLLDSRPTRTPEAIAPGRYRLQFDLGTEFRDELERLQALVRSSVPDGDLAKVVRLAVTRELKRLETKRFGKTERPRTRLAQTDTRARSRHIPAAVRRFVERRDGGRCTYRDKHGRRCSKRHDLEFHHIRAFGVGGDHSPEGIALMCATHNQLLAEQQFGKEKMARHRRRGRSKGKAVEVVSEGTGPGDLRARLQSSG